MMKQKVVTKSVKDKGIADMFNQMLGAGTVNMNICYPKYVNIKNYIDKILNVLSMFNKSPVMLSLDNMAAARKDTEDFINKSREQYKELFSIDLTEYEWNLTLVDDETKEKFSTKYEEMKKSDLVHVFIKLCDNLISYRKNISDVDNLNPKFILAMAGSEFCPFPFSNTNFKYMVEQLDLKQSNTNNNVAENKEIQLILLVLNKILHLTHNLYKAYSKPDIDVREFVDVIMSNIGEVKKRIPRCDKAFSKIEESVGMLNENFSNYYKDFIQTQNQMIIMENFVADVAKNTKADPETTRQFRQIISFYRKMAQNQIKNPKVKMLFDKVNESFKELEKNENLVGIDKLSDDEEEEVEDNEDDGAEAEAEQKLNEESAKYTEKTVEQIMAENGLDSEPSARMQNPRARKGKKL